MLPLSEKKYRLTTIFSLLFSCTMKNISAFLPLSDDIFPNACKSGGWLEISVFLFVDGVGWASSTETFSFVSFIRFASNRPDSEVSEDL